MKIGVYDPYLDDHGGGEKYMMTIASCLSQLHTVNVFWDTSKDVEDVAKKFNLNFEKIKTKNNIFAHTVSTTERVLASREYDALILLSDGSIPLTLNKNLYVHIQQPLLTNSPKGFMDQIKKSRIKKIIYNSNFTKERNKHLFPGVETTVIYPPVNNMHMDIKKENIILHVGRYRLFNGNNDFKKQNVMLQTFIEMVDEGLKGWKFVLAAGVQSKDSQVFSELKEKAKGYPVEFLENISYKELKHIYSRAKIYWHASGFNEDLTTYPERAEHFGISTVEAMSAGAVPIVINAGGQKEIVLDGKNGYLWNTIDELKTKTYQVLKNEIERQGLSQQAFIRAKDFSEEKFYQEIRNLIQQ